MLCWRMWSSASSSPSTTFKPRISAIHSVSKSSAPAGCTPGMPADDLQRARLGAEGHARRAQLIDHARQKLRRDLLVNQHAYRANCRPKGAASWR